MGQHRNRRLDVAVARGARGVRTPGGLELIEKKQFRNVRSDSRLPRVATTTPRLSSLGSLSSDGRPDEMPSPACFVPLSTLELPGGKMRM